MTDARTEARRRITSALFDASGRHAGTGMEQLYEHEAEHLADAVLDLFEHVEIRDLPGWVHSDGVSAARQLVLTGPVEPVTEEREP